MPLAESAEWDLPKLRASFGFQDDFKYVSSPDDQADTEFFDVKFYPYNPTGAPPIFAAVSKKHAVVCRLSKNRDNHQNPCEIIRVIRDDDPDASNCACCWTKDPETERAYLCIAGNDAKIKVYNVKEGTLLTTLVGHGGGVNDLATSPENPLIIASASDDTTVRIWSLHPAHAQQPCLCLLGGEGHSWDLLSVAFHETGRYVLSAGHDQVINLWTIPDLPTEHADLPIVVHYPHFSSSEVHSGLVDCVAFFGDCILSRACHEDVIVLWRIEGFSSEDPPPPASQAPTSSDPSKLTRSAFVSNISPACPALYTRLLQFQTLNCGSQFFMRFSIFHAPNKHPILLFCNAKNSIFIWDLARLTSYHGFKGEIEDAEGDQNASVERPGWLQPIVHRKQATANPLSRVRDRDKDRDRDQSDRDSSVSETAPPASTSAAGMAAHYDGETIASWESRFNMNDPHGEIRPHKVEHIQASGQFVGRQVGWSPDGDWCVVVGSMNLAVILHRW